MSVNVPRKTSGANIAVAVLVIAWVAAMIALTFHASSRLAGVYGAAKMTAAPDGTIWVVSYGKLHHFREDGTRFEVIDLVELGMGTLISEIVALADGSLLLAEADPSKLVRCQTKPPECVSLSDAIAATAGPTSHALMVAVDEASGRMAISDNAGHRVLLADMRGKVLDQTPLRRLVYPNQLSLTADAVTVADTNHHRIVKIALANDKFGADVFAFDVRTPELTSTGRVWPMGLSRAANGDWWLLLEANGMKDGFLMAYDADGKPKGRIDLGEIHDPTHVLVLGTFALAASPIEGKLEKLSLDGKLLGAFGDAAFAGDLEEGKAAKERWSAIRNAARVAMVVLPLLGIGMLFLRGERVPRGGGLFGRGPRLDFDSVHDAGPPLPLADGAITWIAFNETGMKKFWRTQSAVAGLLLLAYVALMYSFFRLPSGLRTLNPLLMLTIFPSMVVVMVGFVLLVVKARGFLRLGTDGKFAYFHRRNREPLRWPLQDVLATNNSLLFGTRAVRLRLPTTSIYDEEQLKRVLLTRLPREAWVNPAWFFITGIRRGALWAWGGLVTCVLMVLFFAYKHRIDAFIKSIVAGLFHPQ